MTVRAVIIGLLGALFISCLGYLVRNVAGLESLIAGNQAPASVFGTLVVVAALTNPLLHKLRRSLALRARELAVVVVLMLVACSIPSLGLLSHFTQTISLPAYWNSVDAGWRNNGVLSYVPPPMLAGGGRYDRAVHEPLLTGIGRPGQLIGLDRVPWSGWAAPLATWMPLVVMMAASALCLALIVHRQWSTHERLRYPIPEFAAAMMNRPEGRAIAPVFRARVFWIGLGGVLAIRMVNSLNVWCQTGISIPTVFDFLAVGEKFPNILNTPFGGSLLQPRFYFALVAFAYFLASDVSLSVGITQIISVLVMAVLLARGFDVSSNIMSGGLGGWQRAGSYMAFVLILLYTGRRYYRQVLAAAVTGRRGDRVERSAIWACRILILCFAAMTAILISLGLDWPLAIGVLAMILMVYVCVARITAETGLYYIQPRWQPLGVLLGLMGSFALGPKAIIMAGMLCAVLSIDVGQALMPYFVNGLRIAEKTGLRASRLGRPAALTYGLCLAPALVIVLWASYNYGLPSRDFTFRRIPRMSFDPASKAITELKLTGELAESVNLSPLARLARIRPDKKFLWSAGTGVALVLILGGLRLRFSWWPIHPVMVLLWDTTAAAHNSPSFLAGWGIKTAVTRLGGYGLYQRLKPLMFGIIAGDFLAALIGMVVGAVYYASTGLQLPRYAIFP